jgi:hypothetical protein
MSGTSPEILKVSEICRVKEGELAEALTRRSKSLSFGDFSSVMGMRS